MKWQLISLECGEDVTVKHYRLFKLFGARLHYRPEINCWEFRLSYFSMVHSPKPMQEGLKLSIPIPFMKDDHWLSYR